MTGRPILRLPNGRDSVRPTGSPRNIPRPRGPGRTRQTEKFSPTFESLSAAINKEGSIVELRSDPLGIAPERALVFETAGEIQGFIRAARAVGLSVISQSDHTADFLDEFYYEDGQPLKPSLYATMPTLDSINNLLLLWNAYQNGETLPTGTTPWRDVFDLLMDIRVWGPEDRFPETIRRQIADQLPFDDMDSVHLEVEILPVESSEKRAQWSRLAEQRIIELGGRVIDRSVIDEAGFTYEALLVVLTASAVRQLIENPNDINGLASVEGIQLILPQTVAQSSITGPEGVTSQQNSNGSFDSDALFRGALLDGTVVASHPSLENGIQIEDLNELVGLSQVANRYHATSMASLILRGDLEADGEPLTDCRILNIPILVDTEGSGAKSPSNRLFVDLVHTSLVRLFDGDEPIAPQVFVINFSVGVSNIRFSGSASALARLLDWWAYTHGILFVISAGNITDDLIISEVTTTEFEDSSQEEQRAMVRAALRERAFERTLLSPAEAINGLTVGALSEDLAPAGPNRGTTPNYQFIGDHGNLPSISSAIGLGKSRSIKPDILTSGGVHELQAYPSNGNTRLKVRPQSQQNGLVVASPIGGAQASVQRARGTSCATALATRSILKAADRLVGEDGPYQGEELPREDLALITRALAVNSATWSNDATDLYEEEKIVHGAHRHAKAKEEVAKYFGHGILAPTRMQESSESGATLVGLGSICVDQAKIFDFPLPPSLAGDKMPRSMHVTLTWFSPVDNVGARYRMASLEAFADAEDDSTNQDNEWSLGLKTAGLDQNMIKKGSVWSRRLIHTRLLAPDYDEDAHIPIRVQCRDAANGALDPDQSFRFAIVVSLELEASAEYDIYEEIQTRLRLRVRQ